MTDLERFSEFRSPWVKPRGRCKGCNNVYPHVPANCEGCDIAENWNMKYHRDGTRRKRQ